VPDIFLFAGESNPNDIKLRDPTSLAGGSPINCTIAATIALNCAAVASQNNRGAIASTITLNCAATGATNNRAAIASTIALSCAASAQTNNRGTIAATITVNCAAFGTVEGGAVVETPPAGNVIWGKSIYVQPPPDDDVSCYIDARIVINCRARGTVSNRVRVASSIGVRCQSEMRTTNRAVAQSSFSLNARVTAETFDPEHELEALILCLHD
jgi:hypothetical protein